MKKLIGFMIVSAFILAPALSMAETKPAEKPKTETCCKKSDKKACCKDGEKKACCDKTKKAEAPKK